MLKLEALWQEMEISVVRAANVCKIWNEHLHGMFLLYVKKQINENMNSATFALDVYLK